MFIFGSEALRRQASDMYFVRTTGLVAAALVLMVLAGLLAFIAWWLRTWRNERLRPALVFLARHVPWFAMMAAATSVSVNLEHRFKWPYFLTFATTLVLMFAIGVPWWRWAYPADRHSDWQNHKRIRFFVRAMCAYLILRDKVIKPLLADVVRRFGRAPKVQAPVDQHYVRLREELNRTRPASTHFRNSASNRRSLVSYQRADGQLPRDEETSGWTMINRPLWSHRDP